MTGPTDVRTGRTNGDASSPSADTSPSVTRALAYGSSPLANLDKLIDLIASAVLTKGPIRQGPVRVDRDPAWKRHQAEARAACIGRDLCSFPGCLRACGEPDEPWCWGHSPDDVAIRRAMDGDPVPLMTHERHEAARRLLAAGVPRTDIAKRLHISHRQVERISAGRTTERTAA